MKWIVVVLALSSVSAFAQQDCLKIKNSLDRRYCLDKYLETVKDKHETERSTWGTGLPEATKKEKTAALENEIQMKREWVNLMSNEIALSEKQLADLKAVPVATAAAAPAAAPAKKKKKKGGFKIKL